MNHVYCILKSYSHRLLSLNSIPAWYENQLQWRCHKRVTDSVKKQQQQKKKQYRARLRYLRQSGFIELKQASDSQQHYFVKEAMVWLAGSNKETQSKQQPMQMRHQAMCVTGLVAGLREYLLSKYLTLNSCVDFHIMQVKKKHNPFPFWVHCLSFLLEWILQSWYGPLKHTMCESRGHQIVSCVSIWLFHGNLYQNTKHYHDSYEKILSDVWHVLQDEVVFLPRGLIQIILTMCFHQVLHFLSPCTQVFSLWFCSGGVFSPFCPYSVSFPHTNTSFKD